MVLVLLQSRGGIDYKECDLTSHLFCHSQQHHYHCQDQNLEHNTNMLAKPSKLA